MNVYSRYREISADRAAQIRVRGLVQGVGFRPAVWRLARDLRLAGDVRNDGDGVLIRARGPAAAVQAFLDRLPREAPPLSRIDAIEVAPLTEAPSEGAFAIVRSAGGAVRTGVVPDAATCPACLAEVLDPGDRRYRYPFANCTHCGPRLSIVRAIPYDRANTSMHAFPLCADCAAEYGEPGDRRFHAQPTACAVCGPRLWLEDESGHGVHGAAGQGAEGQDAIALAQARLAAGAIVAVKGIGGFHLACDAGHEAAVARLRQRKRRYLKPFALMARDLAMVRAYARASAAEAALLESAAAPIVVLDRRASAPPLAPAIAPGQNGLGFLLPYTPLHHLLARGLARPLVLTSGNRSDEPQCSDNDDARERLSGIAEFWLLHDREIVNRLDDSVVRLAAAAPRLLRRARGYAPAPIPLPPGFEAAPAVLAMGGELKNSFCLLKDGRAILSPHIGDLEDPLTHADYRKALALFRDLFDFAPELVAVDGHPDYLASQWGRKLSHDEGVPLCVVQHHHAHLAACLAEWGGPLDGPPVLGVILDGLGYGEAGELWGGEFLLGGYAGVERLARFAPVALPGGAQAMREPWRNSYAHVRQFIGWDEAVRRWPGLPIVRFLAEKPLGTLDRMIAHGINAPPASSAGRLFDAAAAALGLCREAASYEGQAAIELEALAEAAKDEPGAYPFERLSGDPPSLGWGPLWRALLDDLAAGTAPARVAARFHNGVTAALVETAHDLVDAHGVKSVALSGGVFQNRILLEGVTDGLASRGLDVLSPKELPANDGGLSLGQAAVAAARRLHMGGTT